MADRHKTNPIQFRPTDGYRAWLRDHARQTGQSVNAVLRRALAEYKERHDGE